MAQTLQLTVRNSENIGVLSSDEISRIQEIFNALISSGGLTGVKGGKTIIHFDNEGNFQRVQLDYFPYIRRKST